MYVELMLMKMDLMIKYNKLHEYQSKIINYANITFYRITIK